MVKICQNCGLKNSDNFNFCSNCGENLNYEREIAISNKKLIIISYFLTITFSWGGIIINLIFSNSIGFFGMVGIFLPFFLIQSRNANLKKHGFIQLAISIMGLILTFLLLF